MNTKKTHKVDNENAFTTTELGKRLGFQVSAIFVEDVLGIPADYKTKTAVMWKESKFDLILYCMSMHCFYLSKNNAR